MVVTKVVMWVVMKALLSAGWLEVLTADTMVALWVACWVEPWVAHSDS